MPKRFEIKVICSDYALHDSGKPYRIIAIDGDKTLFEFAEAILEAFDFDNDHAFGFYDNMKDIYRSQEGYELFTDMGESSGFRGVKKPKIEAVYELKKKLLFFYDYGDSWHFITQCTAIQETAKKEKAKVIKSVGEAPEQYPDWDDEDEDYNDEMDD
jgi:hypothetical protein